jgi:hypothetical protein
LEWHIVSVYGIGSERQNCFWVPEAARDRAKKALSWWNESPDLRIQEEEKRLRAKWIGFNEIRAVTEFGEG